MSDAIPAPCCEDVTKLLAHHPLTAHEIAALLRCSVKQALDRIHSCWWEITPKTWDGPGWRYSLRHSLSKSVAKPINRDRQYENALGTMVPGGYYT
jgi:hypothetical protein